MAAIIGHEGAEAAFLDAWRGGRLHHAWLLAGPQGMGKSAFADAVARFLVTHGPAGSAPVSGLDDAGEMSANHLVEAGNHPEILHLTRLAKEKTKDIARSISIDQVRQMIRRLQMSLSLGDWRVIIIDAVDDLEVSGANALLKTLEEPPAKTLFLLVSHSPGKLLPTIRSRCRTLRFQPVGGEAMQGWLKQMRPMLETSEVRAVAQASGGVPGRALALIDSDVSAMEMKLRAIAESGDPQNLLRSELAKELGGVANRAKLELAIDMVPNIVANIAKNSPIPALGAVLQQWDDIHQATRGAVAGSYDGAMIGFAIGNCMAALAPILRTGSR